MGISHSASCSISTRARPPGVIASESGCSPLNSPQFGSSPTLAPSSRQLCVVDVTWAELAVFVHALDDRVEFFRFAFAFVLLRRNQDVVGLRVDRESGWFDQRDFGFLGVRFERFLFHERADGEFFTLCFGRDREDPGRRRVAGVVLGVGKPFTVDEQVELVLFRIQREGTKFDFVFATGKFDDRLGEEFAFGPELLHARPFRFFGLVGYVEIARARFDCEAVIFFEFDLALAGTLLDRQRTDASEPPERALRGGARHAHREKCP